jgi:hypothetical protein
MTGMSQGRDTGVIHRGDSQGMFRKRCFTGMRQRVESQRNEPTQCLRCLFMATAIEKITLIIDVTWYFIAFRAVQGCVRDRCYSHE